MGMRWPLSSSFFSFWFIGFRGFRLPFYSIVVVPILRAIHFAGTISLTIGLTVAQFLLPFLSFRVPIMVVDFCNEKAQPFLLLCLLKIWELYDLCVFD